MSLTPRENLIRAARRQGFEWVPLDILLCDSQVRAFKEKFGEIDYFDWFGVDFRWVTLTEHLDIPMAFNYIAGRRSRLIPKST